MIRLQRYYDGEHRDYGGAAREKHFLEVQADEITARRKVDKCVAVMRISCGNDSARACLWNHCRQRNHESASTDHLIDPM